MVTLVTRSVDTNTFYLMTVAIITTDTVYADTSHFWHELVYNLAVKLCTILHCMVKHCRKFIAAHHSVTIKIAVRIAFNDACSGQLVNIFVSPMIFRNVREKLQLIFVNTT